MSDHLSDALKMQGSFTDFFLFIARHLSNESILVKIDNLLLDNFM